MAPMGANQDHRFVLDEILRRQHGVITRAQALACGLTPGFLRHQVNARRWRRLRPGIFATFTGPLPRPARLWAAVLAAGRGACLSHESAAELQGLADPVEPIHITVPGDRTVRRIPGVRIHRSARVAASVHPVREPPQTRIEETVLDLTQTAPDLTTAYDWIARAVGARRTTPRLLLAALARRPKMRRRRELREGLGDVAAGCLSVLERSYRRDVELAHGLPRADRQVPVATRRRRNYLDARYREYTTRVELDGRAAHPYGQRFRDMKRDNAGVRAGDATLRCHRPDCTIP